MRITKVLRTWLANLKDEESLDIVEEGQRGTATCFFALDAPGRPYCLRCRFECFEEPANFQLYMYWCDHDTHEDIVCPDHLMEAAMALVAALNNHGSMGCLQLVHERGALRLLHAMALDNAAFEPAHIENLVGAGMNQAAEYFPLFHALYFENKSLEEILSV